MEEGTTGEDQGVLRRPSGQRGGTRCQLGNRGQWKQTRNIQIQIGFRVRDEEGYTLYYSTPFTRKVSLSLIGSYLA